MSWATWSGSCGEMDTGLCCGGARPTTPWRDELLQDIAAQLGRPDVDQCGRMMQPSVARDRLEATFAHARTGLNVLPTPV